MIIGTKTIGSMKSHNDQKIGTQFFFLGLPLAPVRSVFIPDPEKNLAIEFDGYNLQSVLKGYLEWWSFIVGLILLMTGKLMFLGLILFGSSFYFFFVFGRTKDSEIKNRILYESAIGINLIPEYANKETARTIRNNIYLNLKNHFPNKNFAEVIEIIKSGNYDKKLNPKIFAMLGFQIKFKPEIELIKIYKSLKDEYSAVVEKLGLFNYEEENANMTLFDNEE